MTAHAGRLCALLRAVTQGLHRAMTGAVGAVQHAWTPRSEAAVGAQDTPYGQGDAPGGLAFPHERQGALRLVERAQESWRPRRGCYEHW